MVRDRIDKKEELSLSLILNESEMGVDGIVDVDEHELTYEDLCVQIRGCATGEFEFEENGNKKSKHKRPGKRNYAHDKIKKLLEDKKYGIGDTLKSQGTCVKDSVTVFKIILDNALNGHELILDILDSFVKNNEDGCSKCLDTTEMGLINIDLTKMFRKSVSIKDDKMRFVRNLMDIQAERGNDGNIKQIFQHPVVETLILLQWEEYQMMYITKVRIFMMFVFIYTFYVGLRIIQYPEHALDSRVNCTDNESWFNNSDLFVGQMLTQLCENLPGISESNITSKDFFINENLTQLCQHLSENKANCTESFQNESMIHHESMIHIDNNDESMFPLNLTDSLFNQFPDHRFRIVMGIFGFLCIYQLLKSFLLIFELCCACAQGEKDPNKNKHRQKMLLICMIDVPYFFFVGVWPCLLRNEDALQFLETSLYIHLTFLFITEAFQMIFFIIVPSCKETYKEKYFGILKKSAIKIYFRDPATLLEMFCLLSVPFATSFCHILGMDGSKDDYDGFHRGLIALSVFSAWMELIFKLGNVSYSDVGDFIKMFYNIIKSKLWAYIKVCLLLMIALTAAFWIIIQGYMSSETAYFKDNFWFNLVLTSTVTTGEFNTSSLHNALTENRIIKAFAMIFLIIVVVLGNITMINLLVATIINDYEKLKAEADIENLYFIARYIEVDKSTGGFARKFNNFFQQHVCFFLESCCSSEEPALDELNMKFCPHFICNSESCSNEDKLPNPKHKLPIPRPGIERYNASVEANQRKPLLRKLMEIRGDGQNPCALHEQGERETTEILINKLMSKLKEVRR